jgi:transposase
MEIITGVERRRRWRVEEKLRIVAEAERPGACFAEVARRHEVSRGLLWTWRREARRGELALASEPQFVPVQVVSALPAPEAPRSGRTRPVRPMPSMGDASIEIALADGTLVRVGRDVGAAALRRVLGVLRG